MTLTIFFIQDLVFSRGYDLERMLSWDSYDQWRRQESWGNSLPTFECFFVVSK